MIPLFISKAFDFINHKPMLSILCFDGFGEQEMSLIGNFISGRNHRVVYGDVVSSSFIIINLKYYYKVQLKKYIRFLVLKENKVIINTILKESTQI